MAEVDRQVDLDRIAKEEEAVKAAAVQKQQADARKLADQAEARRTLDQRMS